MRIERWETEIHRIPLKRPFITALRTVSHAEFVLFRLISGDGAVGYGSAPPTAAITGETLSSLEGALTTIIGPSLEGGEVEALDLLLDRVEQSMPGNTSAKAAADMALHDLFAQRYDIPLFRLFGGSTDSVETDITVSLRSPEEMAEEALFQVARGYTTLKAKVGIDSRLDLERIRRIRDAVGPGIRLRIDANQSWAPKEAVRVIKAMEDAALGIEWVEQPVAARDIDGLRFVTERVDTRVMADESLFSPADALRLLECRAVDLFNIKLMKSGGLRNARAIHAVAKAAGVPCMVGCMIESRIGIAAAAHFACGQSGIIAADLDAIDLMEEEAIEGGVRLDGTRLHLSSDAGLGIREIGCNEVHP